jgi:hypothetical protein
LADLPKSKACKEAALQFIKFKNLALIFWQLLNAGGILQEKLLHRKI